MDYERWSTFNSDVQLCGRRRGAGRPVLLFAHGWISSRRIWNEVCEALPRDLASIAFDFRGCGESDRPATGHDLAGYASDLRAVIRAIGGPVVLAAHSMGARVAQYLALEQPENVLGYFFVAPGVARGTPPTARRRELTERAFGSRRRIQAFQRSAMLGLPAEAVIERLVEDALIAQREHWFGWYEAGRTVDFSERLGALRVPLHVVAGAEDPLIPPGRIQREILDRIPGATMRVISGVGHNVPVEAPGEVREELIRFLTRESPKEI
jgi:pimeloyl-ACP methyl ester carboxylesterase